MPEQFSLPMRVLANGQIAMTEQGSALELADRVNVLVRTPPGWLDGRPGFGLADQAFKRGGADVTVVSRQIETWVPEAASVAAEDPSLLDGALDFLEIRVAQR